MSAPLVVAAWLLLLPAGDAAAACASAPNIQAVRDTTDASKGGGAAFVLIAQADLTVARLLCLAEELSRRYQRAANVDIFVFTSREAALRFDAGAVNLELGDFRGDLRAIFRKDAGKGSLTITPIGMAPPYFEVAPDRASVVGEAVYDMRFGVPAASPRPPCRLHIDNRCVMVMSPLRYPKAALASGSSGTVTLTGVAARDGKVTATNAAATEGNQSAELVRAAMMNLSTWQLEPGDSESTFRITYVYRIDPSLKPGTVDVRFSLPNEIHISAGTARGGR